MKNISNNYPEWNAAGTEPDQTKKDNGWQPGEKPPADWFNWKYNKGYQSFEDIDEGIARRLSDVLTEGVLTGGAVTENTTADLNVLVEPLTGFNTNGARINLASQQTVDLSGYLPTTVGNEKYVSVYIDVIDLETNTEINIVEGTSAAAGSATKPTIDSLQGVLLADVLLAEGQTTILNGDIEEVRKQKIHLNNIAGQMDFVNVKDFGAEGDGVTDDTEAIQNAIDYAETNNKNIYVPDGEYNISSTIVIKSISKFIGAGIYNTAIIQTNEGQHCITIDSNSHFEFGNLRLSTEKTGDYATGANGLNLINNPNNFTIKNMRISFFEKGIYGDVPWVSRYLNIRVLYADKGFDFGDEMGTTSLNMRNCYAQNCDTGYIFYNCGQTTLIGCNSDHNKISYRTKTSSNVTFIGCQTEAGSVQDSVFYFGSNTNNTIINGAYSNSDPSTTNFIEIAASDGTNINIYAINVDASTNWEYLLYTNRGLNNVGGAINFKNCELGTTTMTFFSYPWSSRINIEKGGIKTGRIVHTGRPTSDRPASPENYEEYFDTTLGKPIWYNGTDWVDSTGTIV